MDYLSPDIQFFQLNPLNFQSIKLCRIASICPVEQYLRLIDHFDAITSVEK